jgi:hypothetical protein
MKASNKTSTSTTITLLPSSTTLSYYTSLPPITTNPFAEQNLFLNELQKHFIRPTIPMSIPTDRGRRTNSLPDIDNLLMKSSLD